MKSVLKTIIISVIIAAIFFILLFVFVFKGDFEQWYRSLPVAPPIAAESQGSSIKEQEQDNNSSNKIAGIINEIDNMQPEDNIDDKNK